LWILYRQYINLNLKILLFFWKMFNWFSFHFQVQYHNKNRTAMILLLFFFLTLTSAKSSFIPPFSLLKSFIEENDLSSLTIILPFNQTSTKTKQNIFSLLKENRWVLKKKQITDEFYSKAIFCDVKLLKSSWKLSVTINVVNQWQRLW